MAYNWSQELHTHTHSHFFEDSLANRPSVSCSFQMTLSHPSRSQRRHNVLSRYGYDLKTLATTFGLTDKDQKLERFPFGESLLHRSVLEVHSNKAYEGQTSSS